ncbi:hypothetical protein [Weissella minor]|uniref:Uncharacterized protein n=1 Tax=Weissella minor TaxID=1620 RepID=A0A0R2JKV2_9LACO|nr:hypothetical protein [Weissella minor]KRN77809.1 hypothetical protein IV67_GL001336 [Weissella minor]
MQAQLGLVIAIDGVLFDTDALYDAIDENNKKVNKRLPRSICNKYVPALQVPQSELETLKKYPIRVGYMSHHDPIIIREMLNQRSGVRQNWSSLLSLADITENDFGWFAGSNFITTNAGTLSPDINHLTNQAVPNNDQVSQLKAVMASELSAGAPMIGVVNTVADFKLLEANNIDAYFALWAVKERPQEALINERGVESFSDVFALIEKIL